MKLARWMRSSNEVTGAMHNTEWCRATEVAQLEDKLEAMERVLSQTYDNNDWCKFCGQTVGGVYSHAEGCELAQLLESVSEDVPQPDPRSNNP